MGAESSKMALNVGKEVQKPSVSSQHCKKPHFKYPLSRTMFRKQPGKHQESKGEQQYDKIVQNLS